MAEMTTREIDLVRRLNDVIERAVNLEKEIRQLMERRDKLVEQIRENQTQLTRFREAAQKALDELKATGDPSGSPDPSRLS